MTFLDGWVQTAPAKAVGWTLLHSLWEGAAIAFALAAVLAIARSSRVRYAASCVAMLGLIVGFGATLFVLMPREISRPAVRIAPAPLNPAIDPQPSANRRTTWDASDLLPWLAPMWLAGVLLFQLRCLASWMATGRLRRVGVCGVSSEWIERVDKLRARLRMTGPVTLLESCFAEVPVVIGHLRPVILMPVGLLAGLPAAQIEAILLHELAHIRRADYLVNLMQTLVEGLLFYHPAAWWISSSIRSERENCCDDLVVLTNGDAHGYARALAALAENRWTMRETAVAATGGNLVKRIRRILARPQESRTAIAPALAVGLLIVTGAALSAAPLLFAQAPSASQTAPSKYDKWLKEEVAYIITDQERADFKKLRTGTERDRFLEDFWSRRDPTPGTPENEYKDEHYRRIAYTNSRFTIGALPGWKTDRGRIYIQYGPPDEIDSHPAGGAYTRPPEQGGAQTVTYPFEMWRYRYIEGMGSNVILEFVDKAKTGDYRLTMDPSEKEQAQLARPPVRPVTQVQEQVEMAEKQLRDMESSVRPAQLKVLESEAQVEQAQKELEKLERYMRDVAGQMPRAQWDLLESQVRKQREDLEPHGSSIFLSGSVAQVVVAILPNRSTSVTIPLDFPAAQYSISVTTLSSDGRRVFWNHNEASRGNANSVTIGSPALAPGSYTLTAVVKDRESAKQKTYTVNFAVN